MSYLGESATASSDRPPPAAGWAGETQDDSVATSTPAWVDTEDSDRESTSTLSLFEGDEGGLQVDQRRALVVLLKQRFISGRTHPKEWQALTRNPRPIKARLNDLFLELHIDTAREVAFKRQVSPEGGGRPFPTLLYDAPWGREDTIVLVYLRARFRSEQAAGAMRVFVDREDMLDVIEQHRPRQATDHAGDARKAQKAIEAIYKAGLLIGPSTGDRFEVSAAIEVLLSVDKLTELLAWLKEQNNPESAPTDALTDAPVDAPVDAPDDAPGGIPTRGGITAAPVATRALDHSRTATADWTDTDMNEG